VCSNPSAGQAGYGKAVDDQPVCHQFCDEVRSVGPKVMSAWWEVGPPAHRRKPSLYAASFALNSSQSQHTAGWADTIALSMRESESPA
jgi:hypothetical protein